MTREELLKRLREEQARRGGATTPEEQKALDALYAERARRNPSQSIGDMIRGNASEDLPNINQAGKGTFRTGVASMFGSDQDYTNAARSDGAEITEDENGNAVAVYPDGTRAYVNQPGLDAEDVTRTAGKLLSYFGLGKATAPVQGVMKRTGATMAAEGAGDAAMQAAASGAGGDVSIDPTQSGMAMLGGAGGELGGAVLSRLVDLYRARGSMREVMDFAQENGLNINDATARQIIREAQKSGDDLTGEAIESGSIGIRPTPGQRSGDYRQLSYEEMLRSSDGVAGNMMRARDAGNREAIESYLRDSLPDGLGAEGGRSVSDLAEDAGASLLSRQSKAREGVREAYDAVPDGTKISSESLPSLERSVLESLKSNDYLGTLQPEVFPSASAAMKSLREQVANVPESVTSFDFKSMEATRRSLLKYADTAQTPQDSAAVSAIMRGYDNWMDQTVAGFLVSGDDAALKAIKNARKVHSDYARKFEDPKEISKLLRDLNFAEKAPREIAQALGGLESVFGNASAVRVIRQYKRTGANLDPIKQAVLQRAVTGPKGELLGNQAIVSNLRGLAKGSGRGSSLAREVFSDDELRSIGMFTRAVDMIVPKGNFAKSSGTSERMLRFMQSASNGVPGLGWVAGLLGSAGQRVGAAKVLNPPTRSGPRSIVAGGAAGGAAQAQE